MKIHIFGASGSGTTTLGKELSNELNIPVTDSDTIFWLPSEPPFKNTRDRVERIEILKKVTTSEHWIISGSVCGWGDIIIEKFDLAVFLKVPVEIRMERLWERERKWFSDEEIRNNVMPFNNRNFMEYAASYDTGDLKMRSMKMHIEWMKKIKSPILKIEGDTSVSERVGLVKNELQNYRLCSSFEKSINIFI